MDGSKEPAAEPSQLCPHDHTHRAVHPKHRGGDESQCHHEVVGLGSPRSCWAGSSRQERGVWLGDQASILLTVGLSPWAKRENWCGCHHRVSQEILLGQEDLKQPCMGLASRDKLKILWQQHGWWRSHNRSFWAKPERERWERDAWLSRASTRQKETISYLRVSSTLHRESLRPYLCWWLVQ